MIKSPLVHRTFMLFACLTLGGFALLFSPATANAQAFPFTSNYTQQVYPTTFSGCAGGVITLTGEMHFVFHFTETPAGPRIFRSHINNQGVSGFDAGGNQYQLNSQSNETTILEEELRTATIVQYYKLIGHGAAPNERVRNVNHVTFNDNGEITSIFSKFEMDCKN